MIKLKSSILDYLFDELLEEQKIESKDCEVYAKYCLLDENKDPNGDYVYTHSLYVKTQNMQKPEYFGEMISSELVDKYKGESK